MGISSYRKLFKTEGFEGAQANILMESSDGHVAQRLEHRAYTSAVPGSSPGVPTSNITGA